MYRYRSLLALAGLFSFGTLAYAQNTDSRCGPIQGTIAVADDADDEPGIAAMARITPEQALAAALPAVPGATVTDVDLDEEEGFLVYEVDLQVGAVEYDVLVDAGSGDVLCTRRDD